MRVEIGLNLRSTSMRADGIPPSNLPRGRALLKPARFTDGAERLAYPSWSHDYFRGPRVRMETMLLFALFDCLRLNLPTGHGDAANIHTSLAHSP
jgi:hypothetical protein